MSTDFEVEVDSDYINIEAECDICGRSLHCWVLYEKYRDVLSVYVEPCETCLEKAR